jgi:hypothetical protein
MGVACLPRKIATEPYQAPATPYQRLVSDRRTIEEVWHRVAALYVTLDPVKLLSEIRAVQQQHVEIVHRPAIGEMAAPVGPTLGQFLSGLRTA